MQKSIAEFEVRIERRMEGMMDRKIQDVKKRLDAFEVRVLERPAPTIDLSSFQSELACLQADVYAILATPTVEPQAAPTTLVDDMVMDALFSGTAEEEPEPTHTKCAPLQGCNFHASSLAHFRCVAPGLKLIDFSELRMASTFQESKDDDEPIVHDSFDDEEDLDDDCTSLMTVDGATDMADENSECLNVKKLSL
ncbi:hypothetical protein H5410_020946 [Solanum commersonii]|uniref:Integrase core domain containing protein n=1 Tax=Solanum commersonii TaxID=4109 RepID=A0A9J5Z9X1_SOLCO|nr:hypothetical protein H5410_020946 [Solanum commersonii]